MRALIFALVLALPMPAAADGARPLVFFDDIPSAGQGLGLQRLVRLCNSTGEAAYSCELSIGLVMDALDVARRQSPAARVVCLPDAYRASEARAVLLDWLRRHYPDALRDWSATYKVNTPAVSGAYAIISALRERFPCAERSG